MAEFGGHELHVSASHLLQKAVDLERVVGVFAMNDGECIELYPVLLEITEAAKDRLEGRLVSFVDAIAVVEFGRTINGKPDQEAVLRQDFGSSPFRSGTRLRPCILSG